MDQPAPFHHYVPRFYLKGFCDPELLKHNPPQHLLWVYEVNKVPQLTTLKQLAGEHGFYRHEAGDYEQQLSGRENVWAKLLRKILKDKRLVGNDRTEFSRFIGVMSTRGRYFYDMAHTIASYLDEYITLRAHDAHEAQSIRERLTASNLLPPQVTKQWTLTEILETGDYIALLYEKMNWLTIASREQEDYVVTSDTPVSLTDPRGPQFTTTGMRYSRDAEFTLPLDRQHVLFGTGKRNEGAQSDRGFAFRQINRRTIKRAYKAVYAPVNSASLATLVITQLRTERPLVNKEKLFVDLDAVMRAWS